MMWPDRRLGRAVLLWTVGALVIVVVPVLWPALIGAGLVLLALAAWDLLLLRRLPPPRLTRHLPERAFSGRVTTIVIEVENDGPTAVLLDVFDEVSEDLRDGDPELRDTVVPAGARVRLEYTLLPSVRGDRPFGPLLGLLRSPLGLWRRRITAALPQALRVYPDTTRYLRAEALQPQRVFASLGVRPSRRRGDGMEVESLRDFVPGDDPRRIDWAASARRARLVTRLYEHERNHTIIVAVDASRLMAGRIGRRTKLDYAVEAALALAYAALSSADRVGMLVFDQGLRGFLAPRSHRHDFGQFVELLRAVQPRLVEADYRGLVQRLRAQQRQRALIIVLTDFVESAPDSMIAPLVVLARRHRILLVAVRDYAYRELEPQTPAATAAEHPLGLYRRLVLNDLVSERETTLATLRRAGLQTLDLLPEAMTAAVLNRYLAIRYGPER
jgi:uncharacterized protein (DUF58 family)